MTDSNAVLEMLHVSRDYNGRLAVEDLLFRVGKGVIVALVGPNGAGKSTLLKLAVGLLKPSSGTSYLFGNPAYPPDPRNATNVAWVLDSCVPPRGIRIRDLLRLREAAVPLFD